MVIKGNSKCLENRDNHFLQQYCIIIPNMWDK